MSAGVHHVAVTTPEFEAVKDFLHEVLGLEGEIELSSPPGPDDRQAAGRVGLGRVSRHAPPPGRPLKGVIVGDAHLGRVELFEIPPESESGPQPGLAVLSFAVRDLPAVVQACQARGIVVTDPASMDAGGYGFTVAFASVGGLPFELICFDDQPARPERSRPPVENSPAAHAMRPLPQPSELTERFWSGCRDRVLLVQCCTACGRCFFAPEMACIHCFSLDWEWVESAGRGALYSFSVVHRAPHPAFEVPYVLGIVELDEGYTMMTNIVEISPDDIAIGMRVEVRFVEAGDGVVLPAFAPVGTARPSS